MNRLMHLVLLLTLGILPGSLLSQQSDYAIKRDFEERHASLLRRIDAAISIEILDTLQNEVDALELDFMPQSAFLNKALFPSSFDGTMKDLREHLARMRDQTLTIENQYAQLRVLELRLDTLSVAFDSLRGERDRLLVEMQTHRADASALREIVRRLQHTMQAKDRLLFTLVDSLFEHTSPPLPGTGDTRREALAMKLERSNILVRIADVATDNIRFLTATEFQGKDFTSLIDTYQRFQSRWEGLSPRIRAVYAEEGVRVPRPAKGGAGGGSGTAMREPGAEVDSVLAEWRIHLQRNFWASLQKEFTVRGVPIEPFADAGSFSSSIRAAVDGFKATGDDATVFVEDVWKERVDKEWREALSRDSMLGKTEYAALDALISELARHTVDLRFVLYVGLVGLAAAVLWWLVTRKPRPKPPPAPAT